MDERYMKIAIGGFVVGVVIFIWVATKIWSSGDLDATAIGGLKNDPVSLIEVIKIKQKRHVKQSFHEGNCYTLEDLDELRNGDVLETMAKNLRENPDFQKIVSEIRKMPAENWNNLKQEAQSVFSPTWQDREAVGPPGQTQAGQDGEKLVGKTIVDLVTQMRGNISEK